MSFSRDILGVLRGLQLVAENGSRLQRAEVSHIWNNSSLRDLFKEGCKNAGNLGDIRNINITNNLSESFDRASVVCLGLKTYATHATAMSSDDYFQNLSAAAAETGLDKAYPAGSAEEDSYKIKLAPADRELLERLDMEHRKKLNEEGAKGTLPAEAIKKKQKEKGTQKEKGSQQKNVVTAVPNPKSKQKLSEEAKQRTVPSSRIGRMVSFGTLAAGLGIGTLTEYTKRTLGFGHTSESETPFLNQANLERIADTLCKVRGAALKLGQLLSIQDDSVVNPELAKALERVRKSADFMPNWQVEQVMTSELGVNWREKFASFEEKPFAAASIGQVHLGKTLDGQEVAVKIQYPGVARGIESDIDNLGGIMKMWNIFPKGMFLDNLMKVAKRELAWEVDYTREAECTRKFRVLLEPHSKYYAPKVIDELSTKQVFTTELLNGIPVDQCFEMPIEDRKFIGESIIELCLLEILEFRYMQTDPNWANFLYNPETKQILLLDFGASREYSKEFVDKYVKILKAACDGDRRSVLIYSKELGFLTGYESKAMEEAHVDAVMIMGEVFRSPGEYNFSTQDMTARIQNLVPTMLTQRLCPPPEEVYSLHRKLSGIFMLCSKLKTSVSCREKFLKLYDKYIENNPRM